MVNISERLDLLREALPYIQRFKNKRFVVKLSGKITENQEELNSLAEEITLCQQVGIRVAVVHGGGKQLIRFQAAEGGVPVCRKRIATRYAGTVSYDT